MPRWCKACLSGNSVCQGAFPDTADIVKPYIIRNAYFAHVKNILLAMLADPDESKRSRAVDIILQCRIRKNASDKIRQFRIHWLTIMQVIG